MQTPNGRLEPTTAGYDLKITRTLPLASFHAWQYITEPQFTERWIGRWEGTGAVGQTVRLMLRFEEEQPGADLEILECEPPRRLRVKTTEDNAAWDLAIDLADADGHSDLLFTMYDVDPDAIGEIGPGWEYYLDQLDAAISGDTLPNFDDYYPAQRSYYENLRDA